MQTKLRLVFLGLRRYKLTVLACSCGIGITSFKAWSNRSVNIVNNSANYLYWKHEANKVIPIENIATRTEQITELQKHCKYKNYKFSEHNENGVLDEYDMLVIGGGATGVGIALDGITRGLSVALIESNDFSAGASSRSTKLIHGGVRYLERAITHLDRDSWELVKEAILERRHLIDISPHLSRAIPIILPVYDEYYIRGWYHIIKHYIGLKIYEAMAGKDGLLCPTYYLSSPHAKNIFPHLKQQNMTGSIVYYDGIHNDSRMCLNIAMTASYYGANVANYVRCVDFIKDDKNENKIIGVRLRDELSGQEWNTFSKVIINATGCQIDNLREKDEISCKHLCIPSMGTHIILPGNTFSSKDYGLLIPRTADNRVAFLLPFEGMTIAGTTEVPIEHKDIPTPSNTQLVSPTSQDVSTIINEINEYLDIPVSMSDIDAVWCGIRPLAQIPKDYKEYILNGIPYIMQKEDTEQETAQSTKQVGSDAQKPQETSTISRHHLIEVSKSGMVSITGGKWTTYRKMGQDCVDIICKLNSDIGRRSSECVTKIIKLIGSANWTHCVPAILERHQIPSDIALHLSNAYGDKSFIVGNIYLSNQGANDQILAGGYPYTEAEVIYCTKYEMACTPIDILSRRTRLAQLNKAAAEYALPKIIKIMATIYDWNVRECVMYYHDTMQFLRTMHVKDRHKWGRSRHTLDYSRRVVETVLNGAAMTDEAIQFVIDRFWDYHSQNIINKAVASDGNESENGNDMNEESGDGSEDDMNDPLSLKKHKQSRQLFEGCISRSQCLLLAQEFSEIFGDDRVIDALMFTQQQQLGLYEILVSCAACASHRELFDSHYY